MWRCRRSLVSSAIAAFALASSLAPADAQGRIWHVSQLPLTSLGPGDYVLSLTVTTGEHSAIRRATLRVIE